MSIGLTLVILASHRSVMYDASMRTTFSPDPDIAAQLKALARSSNKSMSRVLNEVLRAALGGSPPLVEERFTVEPFPLGLRPGIDLLRLNQLADELDDELILRRLERERDHS